ncbi:MAG: AAA family ATPase, partial [Myxococcales bacterium]
MTESTVLPAAGAGVREGVSRASDEELILELGRARTRIRTEIAKRVVGQDAVIDQLLVALFSRGHCLFVGVPGLAKTLLISTLAEALSLSFNRIQFTPDLMPSDITGTDVLEEDHTTGRRVFRFVPGPVFANVLLADEINRASPKTQSALLEAMEERQVTVDATTYRLPRPFMVIATQNPIELEGTYPLPEAQLDRFLMRLPMGYPARDAEAAILESQGEARASVDSLSPVASAADVADAASMVPTVHVAPEVRDYILDVVAASRRHPDLVLGASPRGSLSLQRASRALAATFGRAFVIPDDVKRVCRPVLRHRLTLQPDAYLEGFTTDDV